MRGSQRNEATNERTTRELDAAIFLQGVMTRSRRAALTQSLSPTPVATPDTPEDDTSSTESQSTSGSEPELEAEPETADAGTKVVRRTGRLCQGGGGFSELEFAVADLSRFENSAPVDQPQKLKSALSRRLAQANTALMLATLPESLPCRDTEKARIQSVLDDFFEQKTGRSMYICGVPGTGKTATTMEVVQRYHDRPHTKIVLLNCLSMASVGDLYSALLSSLKDTHAGKKTALAQLTSHFRETQDMTVLILDEMDLLLTKKSVELYNLFEWCWEGGRLCILGISNTAHLPQKLPAPIQKRMGTNHLLFLPYTKDQMESIVKQRLGKLDVFHDMAIQRAAAKVAHVSGDIRRCLQLLQLAIDVFKRSTVEKSEKITAHHVGEAIYEMYGNEILSDLGTVEKLILAGMLLSSRASEAERRGVSAVELLQRVGDSARLSDVPCPRDAAVLNAVRRLQTAGMLSIEDSHHRLFTHAQLNIDETHLTNILAQDARLERVHTSLRL